MRRHCRSHRRCTGHPRTHPRPPEAHTGRSRRGSWHSPRRRRLHTRCPRTRPCCSRSRWRSWSSPRCRHNGRRHTRPRVGRTSSARAWYHTSRTGSSTGPTGTRHWWGCCQRNDRQRTRCRCRRRHHHRRLRHHRTTHSPRRRWCTSRRCCTCRRHTMARRARSPPAGSLDWRSAQCRRRTRQR